MTYDPKAAGAVQLFDSLLATIDLGTCAATHAYLAAALLLLSICLVVIGAWSLATR